MSEEIGEVSNSFWDVNTSGVTSSSGGVGRTTAQMKSQSTYESAGWDFVETWDIDPAINNGYPYLQLIVSSEDSSSSESTQVKSSSSNSSSTQALPSSDSSSSTQALPSSDSSSSTQDLPSSDSSSSTQAKSSSSNSSSTQDLPSSDSSSSTQGLESLTLVLQRKI
jgi:hypothetical protein